VPGGTSGAFPKVQKKTSRLLTQRQRSWLYVLPCILSLVIFLLFCNVYHRAPSVVLWIAFVMAFVLLISAAFHRPPHFRFWLPLFSLLAVGSSVAIGILSYEIALWNYWVLYDANTYSNVLPSDPPAAYKDAGKVIFAHGARLDIPRSVGYKDGDLYCVAPVIDEVNSSVISYWAIGMDCCDVRGGFDCDDAFDDKARSGVRVLNPADQYKAALKMAGADYGIVSVASPMFVRWVRDPEQMETKHWRIGLAVMLGGLLLQQLTFMGVALAMNAATTGWALLRA